MCNFLSCVSDGNGNIMYFNYEQRQKIIKGEMRDSKGHFITETDSHSSIMAYNGIYGEDEDLYNKYELDVFTGRFIADHMPNKDDSKKVEKKMRDICIKELVPELIIKNIINPFAIKREQGVTKKEIELLKNWASVEALVWASVEASVETLVGASVRNSVWASVWALVWASVKASVEASVWASVRVSVRVSARNSVWAYVSSFFNIPKW